MRPETGIQNAPAHAAASKHSVFFNDLDGLGAGFEAPVMYIHFGNPQRFSMGGLP
ncbi:MAG: hypothetical protein WAQ56_11005 [Candidatus Nitrotoga sp.]